MRTGVLFLTLIVLAGCTAKPAATVSESPSERRQFESAIGRAILTEVRQELGRLKGSSRAGFLKEKHAQFTKGVDVTAVSSGVLLEYRILKYMTASESSIWQGRGYVDRVAALTSLDWSLGEHERRLRAELDRLDQTIAGLAADDPFNDFDLEQHMAGVRNGADYPEDSHQGRQAYLDALAGAMMEVQLDWHGFFSRYAASDLNLAGSESAVSTFSWQPGSLQISLSETGDLPMFELRSVAAFYGYPGLQSFAAIDDNPSLTAVIDLPAYTMGWAGYVIDFLSTSEVEETLPHLYFSKLITGLGLADLRINSGTWTLDEAARYLHRTTPYSVHRIDLMLARVNHTPGYYLAAAAGKLKFLEIRNQCPVTGSDCGTELHQQITELGPLPFPLLEKRLKDLGKL